MPLALILSSHVAASRVGASAQALALAQFKIDAIAIPTVLYGRHPVWGPPGGAAVSIEAFDGMLEGVAANGLLGQIDLIITGFFASAAQVGAAARTIDLVRAHSRAGAFSPAARVVIDPTIGNADKGLYISGGTALAVASDLIPRADLVRLNAWELSGLTGLPIGDAAAAAHAARQLRRPALVSSVGRRDETGVVYADRNEAWYAAHPRLPQAPPGTGDLLTALFGASMVENQPITYALARAVGGVAEAVTAAQIWETAELPIVALGARLKTVSPAVRVERLV